MDWILSELRQPHAGNCATFVRDMLAKHYSKTLKLEQFNEYLDDLERAQVEAVAADVKADAARRVTDPEPGDVVFLEKRDGRLHLGVYVNPSVPSVLHVADRDGRAHCTKLYNLARMGYTLDGFYRVES